MTDRLTEADLARIRAEHAKDEQYGTCESCIHGTFPDGTYWYQDYPCDAARLLAHFAPGPVPHLAGIQAGLLGPCTAEELAR